jgi:hypothetical protein
MAPEWEPIELIALQVACADLHYVASALVGLPGDAQAAELALVQYGAMAAYETQLHFQKTVGWAIDAGWDPATAKAARMSGKFFADNRRNFDGVVDHFDDLLAANHGAFFPKDRRGKLFDFLRDDLSIVTLSGRPYMNMISGHYLTGLRPTQVAELGTAGPVLHQLAFGIGQVTAQVLGGVNLERHPPAQPAPFEWWDTKVAQALPRLFGNQLPASVAASLMTVHSILMSATRAGDRVQCGWCALAARKHRFVATFQSLKALQILHNRGEHALPDRVTALLDRPDAAWLMEHEKLRNALVHLGMQDIRDRIERGHGVDAAVAAYTGQAASEVDARTSQVLRELVEAMTEWILTPPAGKQTIHDVLKPAPGN